MELQAIYTPEVFDESEATICRPCGPAVIAVVGGDSTVDAANIQNSFGGEGYAGLRIRLVERIFDIAQLDGIIAYQFSLLKPDVSLPNEPEIEDLSLNRHSITFRLDLAGL